MKTKRFQLFKKKWPVIIRPNEKMVFIGITHVTDSPIFERIIYEMYRDDGTILLSQYVDTDQWSKENWPQFINELRQKYHLDVNLTKSYTDLDKATDDFSTFILNIAGSLKDDFLPQAMGFGMTNLPHIVYGPKSIPDNWQVELSKWNGVMVQWFNLKMDSNDERFINLIEQTGPIGLTSDGDLCFCITRLEHFNKLLKIISNISEEDNFSLELKVY
jgi:hypothetical protein